MCVIGAAGLAGAQPLAITFRNVASLPNSAVDQNGVPFTIAGLSGITSGAFGSTNPFYAVMDNSNKVLSFTVQVGPTGAITSANLSLCYALSETRDFEGIASVGGAVYLAEEGTPTIRAYLLPGGEVYQAATLHAVFSNIRPNFGFESLAGTPYGDVLWTANEEALTVDGPASTATAGTVVRLIRFDRWTLAPGPQYAYVTEPWHGSAITGARSGVSDMLLLPDGRLLVLERSFAFSLGGLFQTRIYEIEFTGATNISSLPGLIGQTYTPVSKRLLYQGDQQNMEGLALGEQLGAGRYSLIGIVDDGDPISENRLVAFELTGVGGPLCYPNCDHSNAVPSLTANDFQCYLNSFAMGESYANCDGSTSAPMLTANDFQCFLNRFAMGCLN